MKQQMKQQMEQQMEQQSSRVPLADALHYIHNNWLEVNTLKRSEGLLWALWRFVRRGASMSPPGHSKSAAGPAPAPPPRPAGIAIGSSSSELSSVTGSSALPSGICGPPEGTR